MRRAPTLCFACGIALFASASAAAERPFAFTRASEVLVPDASELRPWTTFRAGRDRYYSALDGRLELAHGLARGLELSLLWSFRAQSRDVVGDELTGQLARRTESELASASLGVAYQLSDARADLLGAGLYFEASLGPERSQLAGALIADRKLGLFHGAANLGLACALEPERDSMGARLETAWVLEPTLAVAYALPLDLHLGLELRAPLGLAGERRSSALFGGPLIGFAGRRLWLTLGVQPQLLAFSGRSDGSRLDLEQHERLEVRLKAGFLL
jgi:hypothetical protein